MPQKFANQAITTLAADLTSGGVSLTLASATNWPSSLASGEYLVITLINGSTREIIRATTISTVTVSGITRAQEGTSASAFPTGSTVMIAVTRAIMDAVFDEREPAVLAAQGTKPGTPASGFATFCVRTICGRQMLAYVDPNGIEVVLQPVMAFRKLHRWFPATTTTMGAEGMTPTTAATLSHVAPATTNIGTIGYGTTFSTSTTAGNASGARDAVVHVWGGGSAGRGGFDFKARVGSGAIALAGAQVVVGLASTVAALAGEPSALTDVLALTKDAADTNWQFSRRTASGTVVKTDLGLAYATNQVLDVQIYQAPNSGTIFVRILSHAFDGTFTTLLDTSYTTSIPANTTLLGRNVQVRNGVTAAAASLISYSNSIESNF